LFSSIDGTGSGFARTVDAAPVCPGAAAVEGVPAVVGCTGVVVEVVLWPPKENPPDGFGATAAVSICFPLSAVDAAGAVVGVAPNKLVSAGLAAPDDEAGVEVVGFAESATLKPPNKLFAGGGAAGLGGW
jgi:hypothetical protein